MSSSYSFCGETYVLVGEVKKAHGLHGELKIHCYSGQPENFRSYKKLVLVGKHGGMSAPLSLLELRIQGPAVIVLLEDITDRNMAEFYVGHGVLIGRQDLPPPGNGEFYWQDIVGRKVLATDGRRLGTVVQLFSNGAQDIIVIHDGEREYMVPVVEGIVVSIDREEIIIDPPQGLLEINSSLDD